MPSNTQLIDDTIALHLDLERVSLSTRQEILQLLIEMEKELVAKLASGVTDWSRARITKQLKEADAIIKQYYGDAAGITLDTTAQAAEVAASATAQTLSVAVGGQVAIGVLPTQSYFEALASNAIIQGAVQSEWWAKQAEDVTFKFQTAVRQGLVAAETNQQIIKRVLDATDLSKRAAETLVRTSVQTVANDARDSVFQDNEDILKGKEWLAALDRRTCPVCGALDGKVFKINDPVKPPKHWRCRCSMLVVLKSPKELGINLPEFTDTTRASMDGQVADKTFAGWLARKEAETPGFSDKILGKGRAEMWKKGKITMDQMIDGAKPMSLKELRRKYTN